MSHRYQHIHITYDNNCGNNEEKDLYVSYNNSSDYTTVFDKDGDYAILAGTDNYIYLLLKALSSANINSEEYDQGGCGFTSREISYHEIPYVDK